MDAALKEVAEKKKTYFIKFETDRTLQKHTEAVRSVSFSPARDVSGRILTASLNRTAKVWDAKSGAEILTLLGHTDGVASASFSPEGSLVVTGSYDNTAKVWDARKGAEALSFEGHTDQVCSASLTRFRSTPGTVGDRELRQDSEDLGREDGRRTPHASGADRWRQFGDDQPRWVSGGNGEF